jgi:hypothetical protein
MVGLKEDFDAVKRCYCGLGYMNEVRDGVVPAQPAMPPAKRDLNT